MARTVEAPTGIQEELAHTKGMIGMSRMAEMLGESYRTVYRRARAGKIPCMKFGYRYKFDPKKVAAWIEEHRVA